MDENIKAQDLPLHKLLLIAVALIVGLVAAVLFFVRMPDPIERNWILSPRDEFYGQTDILFSVGHNGHRGVFDFTFPDGKNILDKWKCLDNGAGEWKRTGKNGRSILYTLSKDGRTFPAWLLDGPASEDTLTIKIDNDTFLTFVKY